MRTMLLIAVLLLAGCTSETDARRALEAEGFKDIKVTGYDWFACAKDDTFHTGFTATNREGKHVSGVVCSGLLFKGATVRY